MTAAQWQATQKNAKQLAADTGIYVAVCNAEGEPVFRGLPLLDLQSSVSTLGLDEISVVIPVDTSGGTSPLVDMLIGDGLGKQDGTTGALVPAMDGGAMVVVQTATGGREGYVVRYPEVVNDSVGPRELHLKAIHMNTLLDWHPCPSVPGTWGLAPFSSWAEDASSAVSGQKYKTPRQLAPVQFATVAWGHTSKGPGVQTIRTVIQDSLDAVNKLHGFTTPHLVVDWSPITQETDQEVLIVRDDRYLWETIAEPARLFGIQVKVVPWWPGDPAFPIRGGVWDKQVAVGRVIVKMIGA